MQRHTFAKLVNELRDLPQIQSKRELIIKTLKAYGVEPEEPTGKNPLVLDLLKRNFVDTSEIPVGFTKWDSEDYGSTKEVLFKHEPTGTFYRVELVWQSTGKPYKLIRMYQVQAEAKISYSFKEFPDGI